LIVEIGALSGRTAIMEDLPGVVIGHDGRVRDVLVGAHTFASFEAALGHLR
jgi:hypothetical protein